MSPGVARVHDPSPAAAPAGGAIERARPLLGTLVRIRVAGVDAADAHAAIERGFAAIEAIHALMSFHEPAERRQPPEPRCGPGRRARGPATREVLQLAVEVASASSGVFDVTVAPLLVDAEFLPAPASAPRPDPLADWRDIGITDDEVRFHRPLWVDLGGIAKGYAVDAALAAMALPPQASACVDAGGDLRVCGAARRVS
jgi:FAD:protein FMN transferase